MIKIVREIDLDIELGCNCGKRWRKPIVQLCPDSLVWCPECKDHVVYSDLEKFSDEKEIQKDTPAAQ